MAAPITGPSTTQSPYLTPTNPSVQFTSLLSAGDTVPGATNADGTPWRFVGIPDGIGAYDNRDGTLTVLVNHEITPTSGIVRDHGSLGAFVSELVIDWRTLAVVGADDLGKQIYLYDAATGTWEEGTTAINRLCSADLADPSAFYDAVTGLGTTARIFLNGEEAGIEGRAFAWIASGESKGEVWELPHLGKFSWENAVASPNSGARTVVMGTDDATPGQVYVYIGDKRAAGNDIEKAGLADGKLYGIKTEFATEVSVGQPLEGRFVMANTGDVSGSTGQQLQDFSNADRTTAWLRPEDGAWDTQDPNRFYFVTTNAFDQPSRLWALDFFDIKTPEWGGTFTALLDGTEGQRMFDNLTVAADGKVLIQEDPGNQTRLAKVWVYDPKTDVLIEAAQHDPARFGTPPVTPFNQGEESSGVVEVTNLFPRDPGQRKFLVDTQAHYALRCGRQRRAAGDRAGRPVDADDRRRLRQLRRGPDVRLKQAREPSQDGSRRWTYGSRCSGASAPQRAHNPSASTVARLRVKPARVAAAASAAATAGSLISAVTPQLRQIRNWCGCAWSCPAWADAGSMQPT